MTPALFAQLTMQKYRTADFEFELPREPGVRASYSRRGDARLLVLDRQVGRMEHRQFREVGDYLKGRPVYVNNSKLLPHWIPLVGDRRHEGRAFLIRRVGPFRWLAFLNLNPERVQGLDWTYVDNPVRMEKAEGSDRWILEFKEELDLGRWGRYLLPPSGALVDEVGEECLAEPVYARVPGSYAAPTAGVHCTRELLSGLDVHEVTLHTAAGSFYPVKEEDPLDVVMEPEYYEVPDPPSGPVVAVGTTVAKALETWARTGERKGERKGWSQLFIHPPFEFRVVEMLLTNLHQPRETLLMLTCAFGGYEAVMEAYREAAKEGYRFAYCDDLMLVI
jgi:S-adenosylmethionine:tRNA ribosyltransferase-isomerase